MPEDVDSAMTVEEILILFVKLQRDRPRNIRPRA
jgi:hypothetical protein